MTLEEFIGDPHMDISAMLNHFKEKARENGLEFQPTDMVYNTRLSQELRAWAHERHGMGETFEARAFAAYFVEGRNLGNVEVLLDMIRDMGLPLDEAREVLAMRTFREPVDKDLAQAEEWGIMSAPTFLAHGRRLVGAHPFGVLLDFARGKEPGLGGI